MLDEVGLLEHPGLVCARLARCLHLGAQLLIEPRLPRPQQVVQEGVAADRGAGGGGELKNICMLLKKYLN